MTTTSSAALGLVLLLAACSGDPTAATPSPTATARLRVVNATAGPPISVAIDGQLAIQEVATMVPSSYIGVPAGDHTLEVRSAEHGTVLGSRAVTFQKDSAYTVVAPPGRGSDPLVAIDTGAVPAAGKVKLRVVHAAPDAPGLDVFLTEDGADLASAFPYVTPFVYGVGTSDEAPGYVEREPGTYQVRFTRAGTRDVLLDTGPLAADAGQVFSVLLIQQSDTLGGGLAIQVLRDR
jgi:hypothetical protein